jgi:hypothetical protein
MARRGAFSDNLQWGMRYASSMDCQPLLQQMVKKAEIAPSLGVAGSFRRPAEGNFLAAGNRMIMSRRKISNIHPAARSNDHSNA